MADRALIGGPAWHALGAEVRARLSREANLATGLIAYPIEAIETALLLIALVVSSRFERDQRRSVTPPLLAGVALSLLGLIVALKAAPIMFSLRTAAPTTLQNTSNDIFLWGCPCAAPLMSWYSPPPYAHCRSVRRQPIKDGGALVLPMSHCRALDLVG